MAFGAGIGLGDGAGIGLGCGCGASIGDGNGGSSARKGRILIPKTGKGNPVFGNFFFKEVKCPRQFLGMKSMRHRKPLLKTYFCASEFLRMNLIAELQARNLVHDIMPGVAEQLEKEMTSGYIGFDPTAESLHVGSMLQITLLRRLQLAGHKPYALVGGATGMIGDPTGKSAERNLLDRETIDRNCEGIRKQLEKFLDFDPARANAAELVNNYDWLKEYSFLDFIRDVGKQITVGYMMSKESVQKRLETGLSFTEFTYQLIQGYDFYYLYTQKNIKLQMGGADQWGNILTGTELVRRKAGGEAFGMTSPLITKADGSKFGKTESGTIWLDAERTSPYQFYQYWLTLPDADAEK